MSPSMLHLNAKVSSNALRGSLSRVLLYLQPLDLGIAESNNVKGFCDA